MKARRGQALTEFMTLMAIMAIYFLVFTAIYSYQKADQFYYQQGLRAKTVADELALAANAAYIGGNGTQVGVYLANANQTVSVVGSGIQVIRRYNIIDSPLLTTAVGGNLTWGEKIARNENGNVTFG